MYTVCLSTVSDREVVGRLRELLVQERSVLAEVLAHLGEVEERKLFLAAACSSMHGYCVRVLGMSEDAAFKRIRAARVARRFPVVLDAIADGRLNLSGVVLIASHLTQDNADGLVAEAVGKTRAEIEVVLARRAPRPDVPARIERVAEQRALEMAPGPARPAATTRARVTPVAPERFALQVTISAEVQEKLVRAQALLRHKVPSGDVAQVLEHALDALLDKVEKRKFGRTQAPRASKKSVSKRYVPAAARRAALARDGQRCSFVGEDGRRCEETGFLELDHVVPVARGGSGDQVRILCRSHNAYEAERILGSEAIERARAARELERDVLSGLRGMGVSAADARAAVAEARGLGGTLEERLRASLRVLDTIYRRRRAGTRCEEAGLGWGNTGGRRSGRGGQSIGLQWDSTNLPASTAAIG